MVIELETYSDASQLISKSIDGYIIKLLFSGEWTRLVENLCKENGNISLETSVVDVYIGNQANSCSLSIGNGCHDHDFVCTVPFLRRYEYHKEGRKLNSGNLLAFCIPINDFTLDKIEEKRNGGDLVISVIICGKITASQTEKKGDNAPSILGDININGEHLISSKPISFRIPKSDWADSLEKAGVCYVPSVENIFCMNELNKSIIDYVKKAKKMYHDGDYDGCVAECRNILETKRLGNKDTKKDQDDDQLTRFKKAFDLIKNLTQLAHHKGEGNPKHNFKKLEAKCILATSISFAELMVEGYFNKEDTTEQQNGDQQ